MLIRWQAHVQLDRVQGESEDQRVRGIEVHSRLSCTPFTQLKSFSRNTSGQSSNASTAPQWGAAPSGQLDRHTAQQAYQQHYYGSEPSPATEQPIALNGPSAPHAQVQGYDLDAPPAQRSAAPPAVASPIPTPAASGPSLSPATSPQPSAGDTPRPPVTSSGSPVNAGE